MHQSCTRREAGAVVVGLGGNRCCHQASLI